MDFALGQFACRCRRYHAGVARFILLFLIVLLPLRGWTAERMAIQMDSGAPVATHSQAQSSAMPEDCALHMQMAQTALGHTPTDAAHGTAHKGCQSCQLCMPLAALDAPAVLAFTACPQALPHMRSSRFVSADTARDVKPPIS
jgi:hypothetical protein